MDKLKTVLAIANKQTTTLGFGTVALITAGGEQLFSQVVFKCPCNDWNFLYGLVFLLVPALALLVLGYILSQKTWKLFTGACFHKRKLCRFKAIISGVTKFFHITTTAVIAPATWIAVALLNGNYFECAMTGVNVTVYKNHLCSKKISASDCQEELYQFPCGKSTNLPASDREDVRATLRAESQILGWLLIASMVISNLLLTCVARCNSPISFLQLRFWKAYSAEESSLLDSYTNKHAKELAERNVKSFFQQTTPEPIKTPSNFDWRSISSLYRFSTKDHYYSTLHHYVEDYHQPDNNMERMASVRSETTGDSPAVLNFVDEGKMI